MRIVFFGMSGVFSLPPFQALVEAGIAISAVLIPATSAATQPRPRRVESVPAAFSILPVIDPYLNPNLIHLAWAKQVPVWEVASLADPYSLALLAELQPDLIVVACFPFIFPTALLQLPCFGCLNLHPSLLPAYRGPLPLFWMARQGEHQAGVTLHYMDEGADSGDIVTQSAFDWPEGISGPDLERRCAAEGGRLLLAAVQQLAQGRQLSRRPQPQDGSSYFSWPTEEDLLIPTDWEARRAFNFLRAADRPLTITLGEQRFPVVGALGYEADMVLDQPYRFDGDELWIQFQPGVLRIR